jgi:hypothetical protein
MAGESAADIAQVLQGYVPIDEYNATLDALQAAIEERDSARTEGTKHSGRIKDLEGKVRGRAYRDAYDKVRKEHKVGDKFADDVYKLLGIEPDSDEPDEKAIGKALGEFVKDRPQYLDTQSAPKSLPAGEGATRGRGGSPGEPEFRVGRRQLGDAGWMRDNQGRMLEAKRAGLLVIDDD